jgi:hypothetical protein
LLHQSEIGARVHAHARHLPHQVEKRCPGARVVSVALRPTAQGYADHATGPPEGAGR